jgi:hypothetical protein
MPILPVNFVHLLKTDPRKALDTYPIVIAGFASASGIKPYRIEDTGDVGFRGGTILGNLNTHATQKFRIWSQGGGFLENAHHIQMVPSNVAPIVLHQLPNDGQHVLMFTGGLSGCSFIVNAQGGSIACAHLQPIGETGQALHNRLKALNAYTAVYGRNDYDHTNAGGGHDRQVAVVGVFRNGQWKVYAQKNEFGGAHLTIRKVKRIYPV